MNFTKNARSILLALAKLGITAAIFYVIFRKIGAAGAFNLPISNKPLLLIALVIAVGLVFIQGLRWNLLLRSMGLNAVLRKDIVSVWAGHFLNNVLPTSTAGDIVRGYALRFEGASRGQWVSALLLEKLCAVLTALALAALVAMSAGLMSMPLAVKMTVWLSFLGGLAGIALLRLIARIGRERLSMKVIDFLGQLTAFAKASLRERMACETILISLLINVGISLIFYCVVMAMGAELTLLQCFFVVPVFTILSGLPISYGGWGVRELSGIHLLGFYGLPVEQAFSITVLFGLVILASCLPGLFAVRSFNRMFKAHFISTPSAPAKEHA